MPLRLSATALIVAIGLVIAGQTLAAEPASKQPSGITVKDAWVRGLPGSLPSAAYMILMNAGSRPLSLDGADSPDYSSVMLHQTQDSGGRSQMVMVDALAIPAGQQVAIAPNGYHLMLTGPTHTIAVGDHVTLHLHFSNASTVTVVVPVSPATRLK